jgi:hypothetical protein
MPVRAYADQRAAEASTDFWHKHPLRCEVRRYMLLGPGAAKTARHCGFDNPPKPSGLFFETLHLGWHAHEQVYLLRHGGDVECPGDTTNRAIPA